MWYLEEHKLQWTMGIHLSNINFLRFDAFKVWEMAFFGRIGKLLRNSAVKHINHDVSMSTPSVFQAIRSMSSAKLFVGGTTLVYHVEFYKWNEAIIFQISFVMQVFHITLMIVVFNNIFLATEKYLMVIFYLTLIVYLLVFHHFRKT